MNIPDTFNSMSKSTIIGNFISVFIICFFPIQLI
jgi:hypothetical protein